MSWKEYICSKEEPQRNIGGKFFKILDQNLADALAPSSSVKNTILALNKPFDIL